MKHISSLLNDLKKDECPIPDPSCESLPITLVEKMLETNARLAYENGREEEREELVCRLLASDMPIEEISLVLKVRVDEIRIIQGNNEKSKIPDYAKKFKARQRNREKSAK